MTEVVETGRSGKKLGGVEQLMQDSQDVPWMQAVFQGVKASPKQRLEYPKLNV